MHAPCIVRLPIDVQHASQPPSSSLAAPVRQGGIETILLKFAGNSPRMFLGDSNVFSRHVLIVLIMLVLLAYVRSIFFHLTQMQFTLQPPPRPLPPPTTAPDLSILQSHHRNPTRAPSLPHAHHSFRPGALDSGAATPHVAIYDY